MTLLQLAEEGVTHPHSPSTPLSCCFGVDVQFLSVWLNCRGVGGFNGTSCCYEPPVYLWYCTIGCVDRNSPSLKQNEVLGEGHVPLKCKKTFQRLELCHIDSTGGA